jgi:hypothetical protein
MQEHSMADTPSNNPYLRQSGEGQASLSAVGPWGTRSTKLAPPMDTLKTGGGATVLDNVRVLQPARAVRSLLHLQRRYGNRYVQRVLGLARQQEEKEKVTPNDPNPDAPDQSLSCMTSATSQDASSVGLVQQACDCAAHADSGGECEECRTKRKAARRHAGTERVPAARLLRQDDGDGDGQTQDGNGSADQTDSGQQDIDSGGQPSIETGGRAACPVTAVFLSMVAGPQKANCLVDAGKFGAARLAEFRVIGAQTAGGGGVTVAEQFTPLDDPCGLFSFLQPNSFTTDSTGKFDDCYRLQSSQPLPAGCSLKVEQNHLVGGQIVSRNQITFGANSVSFCHFDRSPGKCDFGGRCKR